MQKKHSRTKQTKDTMLRKLTGFQKDQIKNCN